MDWASRATEHADRTALKAAVEDLITKALSAQALPDGRANRPSVTLAGLDEREGILWHSGLRDDKFLNNLGLCHRCQNIEAGIGESRSHPKPYQDLSYLKRMSHFGCCQCRLLFIEIFRVPCKEDGFSFEAGFVDQNMVEYQFRELKLRFEVLTTESS